jgi:hypothetical protein
MTGAHDQAVMNQELYRWLFTESYPHGVPPTLGEAAVDAKAAVGDGDTRRTWMLLGDPTMKLKVR